MTAMTTMRKLGITPVKAGLVVVLSIMLLPVLISHSGTDSPPVARRTESEPSPDDLDTVTVDLPQVVLEKDSETRDWPQIPLTDALAFDPFALPEGLRGWGEAAESTAQAAELEQEVERRSHLIARLKEQGVGMVFVSGSERVATIGTQRVRVGDVVDGVQIVDIRDDGVVVAEYVGGTE